MKSLGFILSFAVIAGACSESTPSVDIVEKKEKEEKKEDNKDKEPKIPDFVRGKDREKPPAPSSVTLTPLNPVKSDSLSCEFSKESGSDSLSPIFLWYKNGNLLSGSVSSTLSGEFAKGDSLSCSVILSDGKGASDPVAAAPVNVLNAAPASPATVSVVGELSKTTSVSCLSSSVVDIDEDDVSPIYSWKLNGVALPGQTSETLNGSIVEIVKGSTVSCSVAVTDGESQSQAVESANVTVSNSPVVGSVSCTGAVNVSGRQGDARGAISCSGATDPDGESDIVYSIDTETGSEECPSISPNGAIAEGAFGAAGSCSFRVKACDGDTCSAPSEIYTIASYSLTASLSAPVLVQHNNGRDCNISFSGETTASNNLSALVYGGDSGIPGASGAASSTGLLATLPFAQDGGSFNASFGVLSGNINGTATTSIATSANGINYVLNRADPTDLALGSLESTGAASVQEGAQALPFTAVGECRQGESGSYAMITAGEAHTCILTKAGAVKCWGDGGSGRLGYGSNTTSATPVTPAGLDSGVTAISSYHAHTCAIKSGAAFCWGLNSSGQLGDGTSNTRNTPVAVDGLSSGVTAISTGENHSCAIHNGAVKCWGRDDQGQLGDGGSDTDPIASTPKAVPGLESGAVALAGGRFHVCAVMSDGTAKCWGDNIKGQIGDGTTTDKYSPVTVSSLTGAKSITAGNTHTCALLSDGNVRCWGAQDYGILGNGQTTIASVTTPASPVQGLADAVSISAGDFHSCALTKQGGVKCWGSGLSGRLGNGLTSPSSSAVDVIDSTSGSVAVMSGRDHSCTLTAESTLKCWGLSSFSRMGPNGDGQNIAVDLTSPATPLSVALGDKTTCAISGGAAFCWGDNYYGQVGDGSTVDRFSPTPVSGLSSQVTSIAIGSGHACAVQNGAAKCWGANAFGQLGDGTQDGSLTPMNVNFLGSYTPITVAVGTGHSCAILNDGTARCWGRGYLGQLGNGDAENSPYPVQVTGMDDSLTNGSVTAIAAGADHTCAIQNGAAKCWGDASQDKLGNSTGVVSGYRTSPLVVTGLDSDVTSIAAGNAHSCAIQAGVVKCWGGNSFGQIGDGTNSTRNTPVTISGVPAGAVAISAKGNNTCAITATGNVMCWGVGSSGQIGDGFRSNRTTPTEVVGVTGATSISVGYSHVCAIANSGLKCWGSISDGELGDARHPHFATVPGFLNSLIRSYLYSITN